MAYWIGISMFLIFHSKDLQERLTTHEEKVEVERAAHLETKFTTEVVQVLTWTYFRLIFEYNYIYMFVSCTQQYRVATPPNLS